MADELFAYIRIDYQKDADNDRVTILAGEPIPPKSLPATLVKQYLANGWIVGYDRREVDKANELRRLAEKEAKNSTPNEVDAGEFSSAADDAPQVEALEVTK